MLRSPLVHSAIEALANNSSGFLYTATDEEGNPRSFSEAQVVAEVLQYFRQMTQAMIGEAIASSEVIAFLKDNNLQY